MVERSAAKHAEELFNILEAEKIQLILQVLESSIDRRSFGSE
jgi:hypothetical protein